MADVVRVRCPRCGATKDVSERELPSHVICETCNRPMIPQHKIRDGLKYIRKKL